MPNLIGDFVHLSGAETIAGNKTFTGQTLVDTTLPTTTTNAFRVWGRVDATDSTELRVRRGSFRAATISSAGAVTAALSGSATSVSLATDDSGSTGASITAWTTGTVEIFSMAGVSKANGLTIVSDSTTAHIGDGNWTFDNSGGLAGKVVFPACVLGKASLNIPAGTTPSAPADGDVWTTTAGMYVRINGATVGPLAAAPSPDYTTTFMFMGA